MMEQATAVPDHDAYYSQLTTRNSGFISASQQNKLATARVLVAGCGSTGGAAVEPLVRLGVQRLILVDNGNFELSNLNRQHAGAADVDRNKAEVAAARAVAINPFMELTVGTVGITVENVAGLVAECDVVIDGVDVTELQGWRAKLLLHQEAAHAGKPVLSGYDMAGVQYIRFYDYRKPEAVAFDGRLTRWHLETYGVPALLLRVVPARFAPLELIRNVRNNLTDPEFALSQLVYAALAFGALSARMTAEILDGNAIRRHTVIDVHDVVRPRLHRIRVSCAKFVELALSIGDMIRFARSGDPQ